MPQWVHKLFSGKQEEKNSDHEVPESPQSEGSAIELEGEESSTSDPDPEAMESKSDPKSRDSDSNPQLIVKHRVPPSSAKGRYSLRDSIVAPQRLH